MPMSARSLRVTTRVVVVYTPAPASGEPLLAEAMAFDGVVRVHSSATRRRRWFSAHKEWRRSSSSATCPRRRSQRRGGPVPGRLPPATSGGCRRGQGTGTCARRWRSPRLRGYGLRDPRSNTAPRRIRPVVPVTRRANPPTDDSPGAMGRFGSLCAANLPGDFAGGLSMGGLGPQEGNNLPVQANPGAVGRFGPIRVFPPAWSPAGTRCSLYRSRLTPRSRDAVDGERTSTTRSGAPSMPRSVRRAVRSARTKARSGSR
jgi:hypothetical protein